MLACGGRPAGPAVLGAVRRRGMRRRTSHAAIVGRPAPPRGAPEVLVEGALDVLNQRFDVTVEEFGTVRETVTFKLPRVLAD